MFMSLISHVLCAWFAFLLPCYSTFKALSHAPLSGELEKLSMYWAIIGLFVAIEHMVGPFISWYVFPFYWELRTIFLLYLSLPQTEGSTYVYKTYLQPFCAKNEADIDNGIASAQHNILGFCQARLANLLDIFWNLLNKTPITNLPQSGVQGRNRATDSAAYAMDSVKSLWSTYGGTLGGLSKSFTKSSPRSSDEPTASSTGVEVNHNGGQDKKSADTPLDATAPPPAEELSANAENNH
ncbi:TB2/DP1, HVA22 family-domain-containing protein [Hygrophoropsis aurantiaca]|uniref:TB2/DP1, HVA22 family-domain-containing protein n=1 Tax=Hygrophoropsis aurantiaca TaxID=72124 RepID=A0ACB8AC91_9AGAM|nr:TB2/DP1, HVA22 family-domain-containing protein [Hygrophoropsis aurantiaca]